MNRKLPRNKICPPQVNRWFTCLLLSGLLFSCDEHCVFHAYQHTGKDGWAKQDTLHFEIPLTDSLTTYHIDLEVRNSTEYTFREVYLMVETTFLNDTQKDTSAHLVCFPLTDKEGGWVGTGWGSTLQNSLSFRDVHFAHPGVLKCKIYHKMNSSPLRGIPDVGLKVEKRTP